jgi:exosome complex component RRP4
MTKKESREIVIPGEVVAEGNMLPGEGTEKREGKIISLKYGLKDTSDRLVKIIPLSGVYQPRRGNIVIGKVEMITFNGWVVDIGIGENAFIPLMEVPRYVNKNDLEEVMGLGDMVVGKIWGINKRGIDLSLKSHGLGKIEEGIITRINPNKVPRVIGKEGSMISMVKEKTGCQITVGQNGIIWIKGEGIEKEILAKKAIEFIVEKSFISGLTEEVEKFFGKTTSQKAGEALNKKTSEGGKK